MKDQINAIHSTAESQILDALKEWQSAVLRATDGPSKKVMAVFETEAGRTAARDLMEKMPHLKPTIMLLLRFGEGRIDERLLMQPSLGAARLRELPKPIQTAALDNGIPYPSGNDPDDYTTIEPHAMSRIQVREVFDCANEAIRSPTEIVAFRRSQPKIIEPEVLPKFHKITKAGYYVGGIFVSWVEHDQQSGARPR